MRSRAVQLARTGSRLLRHREGAVRLLALSLALIALGALWGEAAASDARAAVSQTINAGIDQNQELTMSFVDGTPIGAPTPPGTLIPPGSYQVNVNDNSDIGNVDLEGPGVSDQTGVDSIVQVTWSVTFQPCSIYSYTDDTVSTSSQWFQTSASSTSTTPCASTAKPPVVPTPVVGTTPIVPSPSPAASKGGSATVQKPKPAALPFRGTLAAVVSRSGSLTLSIKGKAVTSLLSGRYTVSVTDVSAKVGFTIQEFRNTAIVLSGASFVGKRSRTLVLSPGQWLFYSSFVGKKSYFIVTAELQSS